MEVAFDLVFSYFIKSCFTGIAIFGITCLMGLGVRCITRMFYR